MIVPAADFLHVFCIRRLVLPTSILLGMSFVGCRPKDLPSTSSSTALLESVPFDETSAVGLSVGETQRPQFVRLSAERTGIDFVPLWTPPDEEKYQAQITNAMAGGGVALGDYDSDGRPDVYLTRPFGGNRLYRNLGDFRFEDVTE